MTKKNKNKLVPYCLGLSLLVAGNAYAVDLGDTGIKFSGGARVVAQQNLAGEYDFGKAPNGRYFNKNEYVRIDTTFSGEHAIEGLGDTKFIWNLYSSFYNLSVDALFAKEAYVGLKGNFGTVQAGKFYTLTDDNIGYGQVSGVVFSPEGGHAFRFQQALKYTTPDTLVKGLTVSALVATDPNANAKLKDGETSEKLGTNKYPWAFDSLVKYKHEDTGFTVLGTYAETHNTNRSGTYLVSNVAAAGVQSVNGTGVVDQLTQLAVNATNTQSVYRTAVFKVGYSKNNVDVTAGYASFYGKEKAATSNVWNSADQYTLALDAFYTMGKHVVGVGYETAPKAFKDAQGEHVAKQLVSAEYTYNFTDKFYVDVVVEHNFDNNELNNTKNGFVKNSKTGLTTTLKYNF